MFITMFGSVNNAYFLPEQTLDVEWIDLVEDAINLNIVDSKTEAALFNLLEYKTTGATEGRKYVYDADGIRTETFSTVPGTIRRAKENAVAWHGVVLDYDHGVTIEETIERLKPLEFILYTSFSHTAENHRFRVVVPFAAPLSISEMEARIDGFMEVFEGCDRCSFSFTQAFYYHSAHPDRVDTARVEYNPGVFLDAMCIPETVVEVVEPSTKQVKFDGDSNAYAENLLVALNKCSGVRYSGNVGRQHGVTLVRLAKSIELSYPQFVDLVNKVSASDSSLRDEGTRRQLWNSVTVQTGITAKVRDAFLQAHGSSYRTESQLFKMRVNKARKILKES